MKEPLVTKELLAYMESLWPDRMPSPAVDPASWMFMAGQVSVTRKMKQVYDNQNPTDTVRRAQA